MSRFFKKRRGGKLGPEGAVHGENVLPFNPSDAAGSKIERNPGNPGPSKKRILVVDDEPHMLHLLRINLDEQIYEIVEASNGKEAIALARDLHPRLILLDLMMPELDGLAVCRTLKGDSATRDIPIVILTARGELARRQSLECGADHFLTKPFSPLRLLAELERFLEEAPC